jgi:hypothetical protein
MASEGARTSYCCGDTTNDKQRHTDPRWMRLSQPSSPEDDNKDDDASDEDRYDQHKAQNLLLQRCHAGLRVRGELSDAPKNSVITSRNTNTHATPTNAVRTLHTNVVRLKIVILGRFDCCSDWFRFTWIAF